MNKIGVFDSGLGGLSVAMAIQKALPDDEIIYVNDTAHVPYGLRQPLEILSFVVPILENLVELECDVIVVACNTVTTNLISQLCSVITTVPIIGLEPMVKPAAKLTKTGVIAVCATPATLNSPRYKWLKQTYAKDIKVLEPDCSRWSYMIETNNIDKNTIKRQIKTSCEQGADVIVLGCTHYHWIEKIIEKIINKKAIVLQPEQPVIKELKRVLAHLS